MVTIIAMIINPDVWIKYTISFQVGNLITHTIEVYLINMVVQILSGIHHENCFFSIKEKTSLTVIWTRDLPMTKPALPSELSHYGWGIIFAGTIIFLWKPM